MSQGFSTVVGIHRTEAGGCWLAGPWAWAFILAFSVGDFLYCSVDWRMLVGNIMKTPILGITAALVLACGCAHSGTTLWPAQFPLAVIPQYNLDSVTRDSASNRMYALVGIVVDSASGRPIQGASITVGPLQKPVRGAYSDDRGGFVLGRVPPGHYQLQFRRLGYMRFSQARDARPGVVDTVIVRLSIMNILLQ